MESVGDVVLEASVSVGAEVSVAVVGIPPSGEVERIVTDVPSDAVVNTVSEEGSEVRWRRMNRTDEVGANVKDDEGPL